MAAYAEKVNYVQVVLENLKLAATWKAEVNILDSHQWKLYIPENVQDVEEL
ncbi:hypothetical protein [Robinsoniella peoriensis]|uniref:hypothetical protein n=1 Tax=Robinsoniella peoriensis TaxID=180332 RepID=UPI0036359369